MPHVSIGNAVPVDVRRSRVPEEVRKVSPQFVVVYEQAAAAESFGLDKDIRDLKVLIELTMVWIRSDLITLQYVNEMKQG